MNPEELPAVIKLLTELLCELYIKERKKDKKTNDADLIEEANVHIQKNIEDYYFSKKKLTIKKSLRALLFLKQMKVSISFIIYIVKSYTIYSISL